MQCENLRLEVDAHLAGEVSPGLAKAIRSHLVACEACRNDAAWAETVRSALSRTRPAAPAVDPEAIAGAVLAKDRPQVAARPGGRRKRAPRRQSFPWPAVLSLAAVLLLGLGLAVKFGGGSTPDLQANLPDDLGEPAPADPAPTLPPDGADRPPQDLPRPTTPNSDGSEAPDDPAVLPDDGEGDALPGDEGAHPSDPQPGTDEPGTDTGTDAHPDGAQPDGTTETDPTPHGTVRVALASSVEGQAEVQAKGSDRWEPLTSDARVAAGDRVRTGKGTLALLLSDDALPADLSVETGPWVRLPAKAEVVVAPGAGDLEVVRGVCHVQSDRDLEIVAGAARLSAMGCELLVAVSPQGRMEATVFSGRAVVHAGGRSLDVQAGTQVSVDRRGKLGRASKGGKRPRWLTSRRAPGEVLWDEPFDDPGKRGYTRSDGDCSDGVARATPSGVRFGKSSDAGGLFPYRVGARIRVRYRLSAPAELTLQVMNDSQRDNFHTTLAKPRVGEWTDAVFRPDAFLDNAKKNKRFKDSDLVTYIGLRASGDATLEVDEVVAYAP